ncbi:Ral guanine nucleotide dissociation stimulator-like 1 [Dinothrombium tinctorium]|uniref:Ral guanine nucleotide dissociation stimulator-like 1 n=1 Tax=Dinothrombium tinctorium TaxID=1965070 RepID=A0A443R6E1_9ACAR|nr:Ral guanine nucleotide dissociation stimulator-like 1 [Dinothrombium tinctorium]
MLTPNVKLPLRRYCSDIDLSKSRHDKKIKRKHHRQRRASLLNLDEVAYVDENIKNAKNEKQKMIKRNDSKQSSKRQPQFNANTFELNELNRKQSDNNHSQKLSSPRTQAKNLICTIRLDNPISVAIQLTHTDKELFLQLKPTEVFCVVIGKQKLLQKCCLNGIRTLIAFREEVKRMVINIITKEKTHELQSKKIAAFIEVACVLRKLRNWNSLESILKALQSPHIYILDKAWAHTKSHYPIHFGDYLKLTKFIKYCDHHLLRTTASQPSLPSLKSFLNLLRIQCLSKLDLCENQRRWTEPASIVGWIEKELNGFLIEEQKRNQNMKLLVASLHPNRFSLLPYNDKIRFIAMNSMPLSWLQNELRSIPSSHCREIFHFFLDSFTCEMNSIKCYTLCKTVTTKKNWPLNCLISTYQFFNQF